MRPTVVATALAPEMSPATYRPAAVSRFLAWADTLPAHGWWLYPALALALIVYCHAVLWLSGSVPFGTFVSAAVIGVPYGPFALGALAYLNRVAARSVAAFWPASGWPDSDREAWTHRFVTTPAGYGWPCLVVGALLGVGSFLQSPAGSLAPSTASQTIVFIAFVPALVFGYAMLPAGVVHIGRQLRLVDRIHREARAIDPFDRVPVYAFSAFTARAGLVFLIIAYYSLTVNGAFQAGNAVSLAVVGAGLVVAAACFVLPLWGIHDRLGREKEALLREVEGRLNRLGQEMYRRIDAREFDGTKVVSEALAGVTALRERIARLPTWPWPPQLFRGFLTALLLPVIVYLISRLIGGRIGA
jgi:hypothetical protein